MKNDSPFVIPLIAVFALSLTIIAIGSWHQRPYQGIKAGLLIAEATKTQLVAALKIRGVVEMVGVENSRRGDPRLLDCLRTKFLCRSTEAKTYFKFRKGLDPSLPLLSGSKAEPVRLPWVEECKDDCPAWLVSTWFSARCSKGAKECMNPESLTFGVEIRPTPRQAKVAKRSQAVLSEQVSWKY